MKKLLSLIGISLLALVLAIPAFAAEQPIKVYINGSNVSFTAGSPYLKNNTVLVPFRVVFEKLGLKVLWDAKSGTVTGTGSNLVISLKIGSNRATVNGTVTKMATAPVSSAGTTYIPLRFIAEATGGTAVWDAASRSVKISTPVSTATDEKDIAALIHLSNQYYNAENANSFYSLMDEATDHTKAESDLNSFFEAYDLKVTIKSLKVLSIRGNEASVLTTETSIRAGGYYVPDEKIDYLYTLVRKNGEWKISDIEVQNRAVLLTREQGMTPAVLPSNDASLIKDGINNYYQALNSENVDKTLAQMTSYGEEYDAAGKKDIQDFFNSYNLSYSLDNSNIYYYGADEAAVFVETSIKDADAGENYKQSLIISLSKSDSGVWTIDDTYSLSFNDGQS